MNVPLIKAPDKNGMFSVQGFFASILGMNRLLLLTVVVPTLTAIIYFGLIASDVYISEARFVVRSPERQVASPLGMLLKGTGFSRSEDDTYSVQDFIMSRDALKMLNDKLNLDTAFSDSKVDIFSRFAALDWDKSFEALYRYYQQKVTVQLDSTSSISTLTARAFTAEDAFRINEQLLEMGEALVNQLNERGRKDMIRFATDEVRDAEKNAKAADLSLSAYRNQKGVIDPERQQVQSLRQAIDAETNRVAGGDRSLANKAAAYQRLALEREFADKQLSSDLVSLEQARNEAMRKQLYLERIVQPSKPDVAIEPRRIRNILATFVLGLIAWGILTMLLASVREHQD